MIPSLQNTLRLVMAVAALLSAGSAHGGMADDFATALTGRTGRATQSSGPRPDGAIECLVKIMGAIGCAKGDTVEMDISYTGAYQTAGRQQGRRLSGKLSLLVTLHPCQQTELTWGDLSESGETGGVNPETKKFILQALQNAIAPVF